MMHGPTMRNRHSARGNPIVVCFVSVCLFCFGKVVGPMGNGGVGAWSSK